MILQIIIGLVLIREIIIGPVIGFEKVQRILRRKIEIPQIVLVMLLQPRLVTFQFGFGDAIPSLVGLLIAIDD